MTLGLDMGKHVGYEVISYRATALHAYRQPVGWNLGFA